MPSLLRPGREESPHSSLTSEGRSRLGSTRTSIFCVLRPSKMSNISPTAIARSDAILYAPPARSVPGRASSPARCLARRTNRVYCSDRQRLTPVGAAPLRSPRPVWQSSKSPTPVPDMAGIVESAGDQRMKSITSVVLVGEHLLADFADRVGAQRPKGIALANGHLILQDEAILLAAPRDVNLRVQSRPHGFLRTN